MNIFFPFPIIRCGHYHHHRALSPFGVWWRHYWGFIDQCQFIHQLRQNIFFQNISSQIVHQCHIAEKEYVWKSGRRNMKNGNMESGSKNMTLISNNPPPHHHLKRPWMVSLMWWHIWAIFVREASTRKYWQPENFNLLRNYFHKVKQKRNRRQKACSDAGGTSIGHFCNLIAADFTKLQKKTSHYSAILLIITIYVLSIIFSFLKSIIKLNYYN